MGEVSERARYIEAEQAIHINLEHPQIAAAKGNFSVEDPSFKRLAYEVAFSEYAIAIAQLKIKSGDCFDLDRPDCRNSRSVEPNYAQGSQPLRAITQ